MQATVLVLTVGLISLSLALPAPVPKDELSNVKQSVGKGKDEGSFSIANWNSPPEVANNFPFYISGYDEEDRPIGIIDLGKWDIRAWTKKGKQAWDDLERHAQKMLYVFKAGIHAKNFTDEYNVTKPITDELGIIVDFDGLNVAQATSPQVLAYVTKYLGQLESFHERINYAYFINVNAVANVVVRLLRPVLGKVMERVEVFGTHKQQWLNIFRRNFPLDQIPTKYGGNNPDLKPLVFYG